MEKKANRLYLRKQKIIQEPYKSIQTKKSDNQWINNYYFGSDGKMATNTWVGNYHVGADGKWDYSK